MSFEIAAITKIIETHYPQMLSGLKEHLPGINHELFLQQLQWAANQTELDRCLHRVHCLLKLLGGELDNDPAFTTTCKTLQQYSPLLLSLVLIDACKNSKEAIAAYEEKTFKALKDSVPFFFDTLQKAPEIYPITRCLTQDVITYLTEKLFYLHQRHLQFGEVPLSSLHEFNALLQTENQETLRKTLSILDAFWMINLMGFEIPKCNDGEMRSQYGPTASAERVHQLARVQACLQDCVTAKATQPLERFYVDNIGELFREVPELKTINPESLTFIGRLFMLLRDKQDLATCHQIMKDIVQQSLKLICDAAAAETACFGQLKLQAITFLPAVFWKLQKLNSGQSLQEIMTIFIKFQKALFNSLPDIAQQLQGNASIPLFYLSNAADEFLTNFSRYPDYTLRLDLEVTQFITLKARVVAPEAKSRVIISPLEKVEPVEQTTENQHDSCATISK